ncbi:diguanylate cyclase (GGDEF) domain-containing protein [Peptoclostridium litorale DSM 5388]|uniref:Phytochrome-like protein Cph2 n=1 Tax=Peptoclostridium litorale DSM 5388 TaxID=1121324 RepID=A0A069RHX2_PEPLI|nr:diguanylate cyclase [Peptoclostridium litorale]KDR96408.1 phytochrome-like protein Cph2 [Peptoclostridium litorale DSM 5388]SIN70941.1 diguanylate cyclase (GGDEF) domain-containing protein [Peptoclostridium litorale DSM 5388]
MIKKILVMLIITVIVHVGAHADETVKFTKSTNFTFKSLTLGDGLSNGSVYTIGQDSRGAMWLGTDDRLNMYDGIDFTNFENDPENINSIASNSASNIFIDSGDNIWIGTWGAGLDKYDYAQKQFTHYANDQNDLNSLGDNRVQTVFQDSSGTVWAGTYAGGLNKLNEAEGTFVRYMNDPQDPTSISNNRIWGICEADDGNLVIATSDGLNYFDVKNGIFESYKNNPEMQGTIASSRTRAVHKGADGEIWVGTESGVSLFDSESKTFQNFKPELSRSGMTSSVVNVLLLDDKGTLWVGGSDGLLEFDVKEKKFVNYYRHSEQDAGSLVNNNVRALYQDRSGLIWVGTRGGGVSIFNPDISFSHIENNTDNIEIETLMIDKSGSLLIGKSDGLFKYTPSDGQTQLIFDLKPNTVCEDSQGNIWAGFTDGLIYKFEHSTFTSKEIKVPFDDEHVSVMGLFADGDDLWVATYGSGLYLIDTKSEDVKEVYVNDENNQSSISGNEIWSIFKDSNGRLWFGTQSGVSLLNRDANTFSSYITNFVYSIHEDIDGTMWLGSRDGLHSIGIDPTSDLTDETVEIKRYDQSDGLPNNMVYCIQEDYKGNLWVSTEYGISKFDKTNSSFKNYSKKNGLRYEKFKPHASAKSADGEIFFGGTNGITSFFPEDIKESKTVPNVIITKIEINGNPLEFDQSIDRVEAINLNYKDVLFSFEFAALDFTDIRSNQYAYMLEGFDSDWIYVKNRNYVSYTSIKPGEYTFRVKASNSDGHWNEEGKEIKIIITPPWWNTVKIKATGSIFVIILLMGSYYIRVTSLKRRNAMLEKRVDERTRELAVLNEELIKRASVDGLTQLTNRRYGDIHLETEWKRAQRGQFELSIIFIDIDYFKPYNDFYGHPKGDECLKLFSALLSKTLKRPSDRACRYGGEEFLLILPDTPLEGAVKVAETIQKELGDLEIPHEMSKISEFVTCSMGIASIIPQNEFGMADLVKSADIALYKAKEQGRNRIVVGDAV